MSKIPAGQRELRAVPMEDASVEEDGGELVFRGYAAVYDQPSVPMMGKDGPFVERNAPGAFDSILGTNPDVRALGMNHDVNHVLARTKSRTLTLSSDSRGLAFEARAASTPYSQELAASVTRGDVDAMSYGFTCGEDAWDESDPEMAQRTIRSYKGLYDIAPVTFAAFTQTALSLRSLGDRLAHGELSAPELRALVQLNVWTDDEAEEPPADEAAETDPNEDPLALGYRREALLRERRRRLMTHGA